MNAQVITPSSLTRWRKLVELGSVPWGTRVRVRLIDGELVETVLKSCQEGASGVYLEGVNLALVAGWQYLEPDKTDKTELARAIKGLTWHLRRDGLPKVGTEIIVRMPDGGVCETRVTKNKWGGWELPGVELGDVVAWRYKERPVCALDPDVMALVEAERVRTVHELGYDAAHDDLHRKGELIQAALVYAGFALGRQPMGWPQEWGTRPRMSGSPERDMVKAVNLLLCEIERRRRLPDPPVPEDDIGAGLADAEAAAQERRRRESAAAA